MSKVDAVSLGNVDRSTSSTRWPARASSIAVGDPAHRAPITIASKLMSRTSVSLRANRPTTPRSVQRRLLPQGDVRDQVVRAVRAERMHERTGADVAVGARERMAVAVARAARERERAVADPHRRDADERLRGLRL